MGDREALQALVGSVAERHHWSQMEPILVVPREAFEAARAVLAAPPAPPHVGVPIPVLPIQEPA